MAKEKVKKINTVMLGPCPMENTLWATWRRGKEECEKDEKGEKKMPTVERSFRARGLEMELWYNWSQRSRLR